MDFFESCVLRRFHYISSLSFSRNLNRPSKSERWPEKGMVKEKVVMVLASTLWLISVLL
jgi:hypothetical protein